MKVINSERTKQPILASDDAAEETIKTKPVWNVDKWLAGKLLQVVGVPTLGIRLWDGKMLPKESPTLEFELAITDRASLYQLVMDPDMKFGELYSHGRLRIKGDLVKCLTQHYATRSKQVTLGVWRRWLNTSMGKFNNISRARGNIHHHYDIGNDFYELWLDREMQYTCAYYPNPAVDLETAQLAKMDHVCKKLDLKPGQTVVEAGCGWGGLARHMALKYGVKVRSYNISKEQILFAKERAKRENYANRVEYVQDDYRNVDGQYDAFVSVGMLEHVGQGHYHELADVIDRCLTAKGRGLIHSIGQTRPAPLNAWLNKEIFPGAYAPSIAEIMQMFEHCELTVIDVENLRLHYVKTLEQWLARFVSHAPKIKQQFDERFYRAYYLYMSGSMAAFLSGAVQLYQVLFTRRQDNDIPWTRQYVYA